jgi:hypothetical protein
MIWRGDPDEVFDIAEALDTEQAHSWVYQVGRLWVDDRSFGPGEKVELPTAQ